MHDIDFNLLYRWFLDLKADDPVWTPETFSMNRERFEKHGFIELFFHLVTAQAVLKDLVSQDHFSVDGTLIQSWASLKSLMPRDGQALGHGIGEGDSHPRWAHELGNVRRFLP